MADAVMPCVIRPSISDPYVSVFVNGEKAWNTDYMPHTRNPSWEVQQWC